MFGILAGCAADTKLTGWFLPLPFLAWTALYRSRRGLLTLLAGGVFACVLLYVLNPPWWTEPIAGVTRFFASNLGRSQSIRIKTLFLGTVVSTPDGSLPWYNTLVWTVFVTPVGFLALAFGGIWRGLRACKSDPTAVLVLGHWAFLMILRALPHTPGHDGVRQFLPAFGMLALLAGLGAGVVVSRFGKLGRALVAGSLIEGAASIALMMPVPLSYYSPLVGGLPGATRLGMEPTYYWDALTPAARDWLKVHTPPGHKVRFATFPTSWLYLRSVGDLPAGLLPSDPGVWSWYVVQNRPGAFSPIDRALVTRLSRPSWKAVGEFRSSGSFLTIKLTKSFADQDHESLARVSTKTARDAPGCWEVAGRSQAEIRVRRRTRNSLAGAVNDLTRGNALGRGVDRGRSGFIDDRGRNRSSRARSRSRGFARSRGRLVAEADLRQVAVELRQLAVELRQLAVDLRQLEAAFLGGRRRARRRGRRTSRRTGGLAAVQLEVARRGVARRKGAEQAGHGQSDQVTSHRGLPHKKTRGSCWKDTRAKGPSETRQKTLCRSTSKSK